MMHAQKRLNIRLWLVLLAGGAALVRGPLLAQPQTTPQPVPAQQAEVPPLTPEQQRQMQLYTPALRQQVLALSPEFKATMQQLQARHTRRSETLTLRQVMQEILADYQSVVTAIAMDNAEHAAESARRLANHRLPKGGLLPYFPLEKITTETLSVLPVMNTTVEGSAQRLAEAAEQGDMATAARLLGDMATGCVACHQIFRGIPGASPLLMPAPPQ